MKYSKDQLTKAVKESRSIRQVIHYLGLYECEGSYLTLNKRITEFGIDKSHFKAQGWRKGVSIPVYEAQSLDEILVANSSYKAYYRLKHRLLLEGRKKHQCENCLNTEWLGNPIPLELHHKNGIKQDHRFENLQMLCPNCHTLTVNFCSKNSQRYKDRTTSKVVQPEKIRKGKIKESQEARKIRLQKREKFQVSKEELSKLVWEKSTIDIAKQFGVCDNAIARRCRAYGIAKPPRGYWAKIYAGKKVNVLQ